MIEGEQVLHRRARALLGWMSEAEAIPTLLGRNPIPPDDLSVLRKRHSSAKAAVASLPIRLTGNPVIRDSGPRLDEIRSRPELAANFPGINWRPAIVDLRKVLSFQKVIFTDGLEDRIREADSEDGLYDLCIPRTQPSAPLGAFTDPDGKGFTVSSFNPNLRIAGGQLSEAQVAPAPNMPTVRMQAVTLFVFMGTSYLQIASYNGRSFVRDGYHRAAALLKAGINEVPCVFIEADNFEQVGPVQVPGAFSYEVLYSRRPPYLVDFWNDSVAVEVSQPAVRKVVRVRGEEFVVPR